MSTNSSSGDVTFKSWSLIPVPRVSPAKRDSILRNREEAQGAAPINPVPGD